MKEPTLKLLDEERKRGFRPGVIVSFIKDQKLLFLLKKEYKMWQLPQGAIENKETFEKTLKREMTEELGKDFVAKCEKKYIFFGEDETEFIPEKYGLTELKNDKGEDVLMKGKKYYFLAVNAKIDTLDISKTLFDDYIWLTYDQGVFISKRMYQASKRRIVAKILDLLRAEKMI